MEVLPGLAKVPDVVIGKLKEGQKELTPEKAARNRAIIDSWKHYLKGLWLSGLRLSESLELWWDRDDRLCVDLTGRHPMLRIPAEFEKELTAEANSDKCRRAQRRRRRHVGQLYQIDVAWAHRSITFPDRSRNA